MKNIIIDLGNKNYKAILESGKKIIHGSNIEVVPHGTFGSWIIDGESYIISDNAKTKKDTNKITPLKRALLGYALYSLVEQEQEEFDITTLLPLSLYMTVANRQKFAELLEGEYSVTNPNGATKTFKVNNVTVKSESFSSLVTEPTLLREPLYLVDAGGVDVTLSYIQGVPSPNKVISLEKGMNIYFQELSKHLTSSQLQTYTENDAEILFNKYDNLPSDLKDLIDEFSMDYIQNNIYNNLKDMGYKPLLHKLVFVGGGSLALERYIKRNTDDVQVLENSLWSNVEGARLLSLRGGKSAN